MNLPSRAFSCLQGEAPRGVAEGSDRLPGPVLALGLLALVPICAAAPPRDLRPGPGETIAVETGHVSDWRVPVVGPAIVRVSAATRSADVQARLHAPDGRSGNPLWLRVPARGEVPTFQLRITGPPSGQAEFRLLSESEPEPDPSEPNDHPKAARPLGSGQKVTFYLYPDGDTDWFTLHFLGDTEQRLEIRVSAGPGKFREELELGISDAAGYPLAQRIGRPGPDGVWRPHPFELEPGGYRCWVRARGSSGVREELALSLPLGSPSAPRTVQAAAPRATPISPPPPVTAQGPTIVAPPPSRSVPPAPEQKTARSRLPLWPFLLAVAAVAGWLFLQASRPRRVFDLTR